MRAKTVMLSLMAAASVAVATAEPALAYPGFTITTNNPGTAVSTAGQITFGANQSASISININSSIFTCPSNSGSNLGGTLTRGVYTTGTQSGTVTTSKFGSAVPAGTNVTPGTTPCTGAGGSIPIAITQSQSWRFNVTGASSPTGGPSLNQTTPVSLTNVRSKFYLGPTNSCTFDIAGTSANGVYTGTPAGGTIAGTFKNTTSTSSLTLNPTGSALRIWNTSTPTGCFGGAFKNGNTVGVSGAYYVAAVSPATNAIWLKS